ncbi:MAG: hypothetical protein F6J97_21840, partial [Leptolyngbya sp. SIO4C1]|nr:hypothetical protein [Leptolyngbya sp. SIO4C1]
MPTNYKTPGVYIEEISLFPPSVAQVETAIPAFIGYTQIAKVGVENFHANPLNPIVRPIRITSLLEYEQFFGKAVPEPNIFVRVTKTEANASSGQVSATTEANASFGQVSTTGDIIPASPSPHNMHYALQAYFANGGGPCYVVSVGPMETQAGDSEEPTPTPIVLKGDDTDANASNAGLLDGLNAIRQEDEVTLIVFPQSLALVQTDSLSDTTAAGDVATAFGDYKELYDLALQQCQDLQDRFVVMDAYLDIDGVSLNNAADYFRSAGIGTSNLKYGAAYGP